MKKYIGILIINLIFCSAVFSQLEKEGPEHQKGRAEYFSRMKANPDGVTYNDIMRMLLECRNNATQRTSSVFQWKQFGPGLKQYSGKTQRITRDPNNKAVFYLCTPGGGLWKSSNNGSSWTNLTSNYPIIGVTDIAIDKNNSNILFIATGDGMPNYFNEANPSSGVMKSTDGGITWSNTGLSFSSSFPQRINKLMINPGDPNFIHAVTDSYLYYSYDGGTTWVYQTITYGVTDMEIDPVNPNVVYAVSNSGFFRSTTWGTNFSLVSSIGLPFGLGEPEIAVCNKGNYVALYTTASDAFSAMFESYDAGATFLPIPTDVSVSYAKGGYTWYTSGFAIRPDNDSVLAIGGQFGGAITYDKGQNWKIFELSPDNHELEFIGGDTIAVCNDWGITKLNDPKNAPFYETNFGNGLELHLCYKLGIDKKDTSKVYFGAQDMGINRMDLVLDSLFTVVGGDGFECLVNYQNDSLIYFERQYGFLLGSNDYGFGNWWISPSGSGSGDFYTPFKMNTKNPRTLYAGYIDKLYKTDSVSINTWTVMTSYPSSNNIAGIHTSEKVGSLIMISGLNNTLFKSIDDCATFSQLNFPSGADGISDLQFDYKDTSLVLCSKFGFTPYKIFKSNDGGKNWFDFSTGIPSIPVYSLVQDTATGVWFAGTELGVFSRAIGDPSWLLFGQGLPNVPVFDLKIQNQSHKLIAGTMGRGVWAVSLKSFYSGVNETKQKQDQILCYPIPFKEKISVQIPEDLKGKNISVSITDVNGKILINEHFDSAPGTVIDIDTKKINSAGTYFLIVSGEGKYSARKIIKSP